MLNISSLSESQLIAYINIYQGKPTKKHFWGTKKSLDFQR